MSADPLRLRAVFDNILSNALKYTPEGGSITIETVRATHSTLEGRETISIGITDTGPGVPTSFRSRIFDKFFRLEHHQADGRPGREVLASVSTCAGRSWSFTAVRSRAALAPISAARVLP